MKIVIIDSGVGNQLFKYGFYKYLQKKCGNCIYATFIKGYDHNGYELEKYFDVKVKKSCLVWLFVKIVYRFKYKYPEIATRLCVTENDSKENRCWGIIYQGAWQDKKYLDWGLIRFREMPLSAPNDTI